MGNTFEIYSYLPCQDGYDYLWQWDGEDEAEAFAEMKRLKETGNHPCLKLEWR